MLPSSAACGFVMAVCAAWMQRQYPLATFLAVVAVLVRRVDLQRLPAHASSGTCSYHNDIDAQRHLCLSSLAASQSGEMPMKSSNKSLCLL